MEQIKVKKPFNTTTSPQDKGLFWLPLMDALHTVYPKNVRAENLGQQNFLNTVQWKPDFAIVDLSIFPI